MQSFRKIILPSVTRIAAFRPPPYVRTLGRKVGFSVSPLHVQFGVPSPADHPDFPVFPSTAIRRIVLETDQERDGRSD